MGDSWQQLTQITNHSSPYSINHSMPLLSNYKECSGWLDRRDKVPACLRELWTYRDELMAQGTNRGHGTQLNTPSDDYKYLMHPGPRCTRYVFILRWNIFSNCGLPQQQQWLMQRTLILYDTGSMTWWQTVSPDTQVKNSQHSHVSGNSYIPPAQPCTDKAMGKSTVKIAKKLIKNAKRDKKDLQMSLLE